MKIFASILLISVLGLLNGSAKGQSLLNKPPKITSGAIQQPTSQGIAAGASSASGIAQNLNAYIRSLGIQRPSQKTTVSISTPGTRSSGSFPVLSLPAISPPTDGSIGKVVLNPASGTPRLIEINAASHSRQQSIVSTEEKETTAKNFLAANAAVLNLVDPAGELRLAETSTDDIHYTHCRFQQTYKGLEVWSREFIVHLDAHGRVVSANGAIERTPVSILTVDGTLSSTEAERISLGAISAKTGLAPVPEGIARILNYAGPISKKVIWHDAGKAPHLVWAVEARSGMSQDWFTFVDANSGSVLYSYNAVCYDGIANATALDLNGESRSFKTYQMGTNYLMLDASVPMFNAAQSKIPDSPVGAIAALDLRNSDLSSQSALYYVASANNTWNDPSSVSAFFNAASTYKYFLDTYNRNSVDDKGMTIYSVVHVTENGKSMENAFWSGKIMCYGDGGSTFKPLAGGLDVAAHEMTHGVTQFSANLEYEGQSGALNESWSDAFGALVDTSDWMIGERIMKDLQTYPSGALRNMADPHNGGAKGQPNWQPAKASEYDTTSRDNHGVHTNSGIPNRAFYLTASTIGRQKAGKVWYRALTVYLTRSSQFIDARIATVKAATDLYGAASPEVAAVKNAWDGVEVFDTPPPPQPPPSTLSGTDWILVVNTDPADPNSIYMAKPSINSNADYYPLTTTPVLSRPSVSDVSGLILFVDQSNNLRALNAVPGNPQETVIDNSGYWESVSIGPGLNSLALTTKFMDTTIYYLDLFKGVVTSFKISTETYDAPDKKTALYADALSFDPTGRYVLFDAYNEVKNATGGKISFWNINILDVTTGSMGSIFPPQAEGISVGNPSYSKISQTRFTFDYVDEKTGQDRVMAADFNTGDVGLVAGPQAVLGFPSYSANDESIVYHTQQTVSGVTHEAVVQMPLAGNHIEGTGAEKNHSIDATFPAWFVVGKRTTDVIPHADAAPSSFALLQNFPNPFNPTTTIRYSLPKDEQVTITVFDMLGRKIAELVNSRMNAGTHEVTWNGGDGNGKKAVSGVYLLTIEAGSQFLSRKMVLIK